MINNPIFEPVEIFDQNHGEIDYDNLCPICYDQIEVNTSYTLECNHKFHTDCIVRWLRSEHSNCPMCNGVVDQNHKLIGIITDGDLRRHIAQDFMKMNALNLMTKSPLSIFFLLS